MKNALAYAGVSTEEQAEKGLSIAAQLKAIREYASSYGFRILDEYVDEGESAKTTDRPEFRRMIKRCRRINPSKPLSFIKLIGFPEITLTFTLTKPF